MYRAKKVYCEVDNIENLPFDLIDLDKYLWDIKADPFFVFNKEFNFIEVLINHVNWVDFFRTIETD